MLLGSTRSLCGLDCRSGVQCLTVVRPCAAGGLFVAFLCTAAGTFVYDGNCFRELALLPQQPYIHTYTQKYICVYICVSVCMYVCVWLCELIPSFHHVGFRDQIQATSLHHMNSLASLWLDQICSRLVSFTCFFCFEVLGIKCGASYMRNTCCSTELHRESFMRASSNSSVWTKISGANKLVLFLWLSSALNED